MRPGRMLGGHPRWTPALPGPGPGRHMHQHGRCSAGGCGQAIGGAPVTLPACGASHTGRSDAPHGGSACAASGWVPGVQYLVPATGLGATGRRPEHVFREGQWRRARTAPWPTPAFCGRADPGRGGRARGQCRFVVPAGLSSADRASCRPGSPARLGSALLGSARLGPARVRRLAAAARGCFLPFRVLCAVCCFLCAGAVWLVG